MTFNSFIRGINRWMPKAVYNYKIDGMVQAVLTMAAVDVAKNELQNTLNSTGNNVVDNEHLYAVWNDHASRD